MNQGEGQTKKDQVGTKLKGEVQKAERMLRRF